MRDRAFVDNWVRIMTSSSTQTELASRSSSGLSNSGLTKSSAPETNSECTMVAVNRRAWLRGAASITALCFQEDAGARNLHFDEAVDLIQQYCPTEFRQAVRQSGGHFLYRGEAVGESPAILAPEPDLLASSTYDDSEALEYFQCLEKQLAGIDARPSKGHIGTADRADAEPWGTPVSVWPLGNRISYVWPKDRKLIYPGGDCPKDNALVINKGLSDALREGKEVLFASMPLALCSKPASSFLAISAKYDDDLRTILL